jgi:hypothetical protein
MNSVARYAGSLVLGDVIQGRRLRLAPGYFISRFQREGRRQDLGLGDED